MTLATRARRFRLPELNRFKAMSYEPSTMYGPRLTLKGHLPAVPGLLAYMLHPEKVMKCDKLNRCGWEHLTKNYADAVVHIKLIVLPGCWDELTKKLCGEEC